MAEKFQDELLLRWSVRPAIRNQPQFASLKSTTIEKVSQIAEMRYLAAGESFKVDFETWCLLSEGKATFEGEKMEINLDYGDRPFAAARPGTVRTRQGCALIIFDCGKLHSLRKEVPQLNYNLRKMRFEQLNGHVDWALGTVPISDYS